MAFRVRLSVEIGLESDGITTKALEVGLRNGAAAKAPQVLGATSQVVQATETTRTRSGRLNPCASLVYPVFNLEAMASNLLVMASKPKSVVFSNPGCLHPCSIPFFPRTPAVVTKVIVLHFRLTSSPNCR